MWRRSPLTAGRTGGGRAGSLGRALDLVGELTKGADRAGRHLAAALALPERDGIGLLERRPALLEEAEQEVVLGARRIVLHPAEDLLVSDRRGALRERALVHDVVDPAEEGVGRGLLLRQPVEGLHAADELWMRRRQRGRLPRERVGLPLQHRAQQGRRLVVQVVAGGHHREAVLERGPIHQVALGEAAPGARRPPRDLLDVRDRSAHRLGHRGDDERHPPRRREGLALGLRYDRVLEDAEVEVESRGLVALLEEDVPERQRILAAGDGHQHALLSTEHAVLADGRGHLPAEEGEEVRRAEGGVVPPELHRRPVAAPGALHGLLPAGATPPEPPPDITGRSSIVSASSSIASVVSNSSCRMMSTVPGTIWSSRSTSFTRRGPGSSTSRRGFRSTTFIRPWERSAMPSPRASA